MHLGHDIDAVHEDLLASRSTQGSMKGGPILSGVDLLAMKHRLDAFTKAAFLRKMNEKPDGLISDEIL